MTNLVKGLHDQIVRCKELKKRYDEIPTDIFGAMIIQSAVVRAEKALEGGDIAEMIASYKELEELE